MTIESWLAVAANALQESGIQTARLDALVLLEDRVGRDRAWLLAHPDSPLTAEQLDILAEQLERRLQHEPLAYIRGHAEFYGRRFAVTPDVLVPRPESETMIDLLKQLIQPDDTIADIGTGSGALAITAALETGAAVAATDIDEACLAVAEQNARTYEVSLGLFPGNLLEPFLQKGCNFKPSVLLANLPYVPDDYQINEAAKQEPPLALFGGTDGLDMYRQLFEETTKCTPPPRLVLTEALIEQHASLNKLAKKHGYALVESRGLICAFSRP